MRFQNRGGERGRGGYSNRGPYRGRGGSGFKRGMDRGGGGYRGSRGGLGNRYGGNSDRGGNSYRSNYMSMGGSLMDNSYPGNYRGGMGRGGYGMSDSDRGYRGRGGYRGGRTSDYDSGRGRGGMGFRGNRGSGSSGFRSSRGSSPGFRGGGRGSSYRRGGRSDESWSSMTVTNDRQIEVQISKSEYCARQALSDILNLAHEVHCDPALSISLSFSSLEDLKSEYSRLSELSYEGLGLILQKKVRVVNPLKRIAYVPQSENVTEDALKEVLDAKDVTKSTLSNRTFIVEFHSVEEAKNCEQETHKLNDTTIKLSAFTVRDDIPDKKSALEDVTPERVDYSVGASYNRTAATKMETNEVSGSKTDQAKDSDVDDEDDEDAEEAEEEAEAEDEEGDAEEEEDDEDEG